MKRLFQYVSDIPGKFWVALATMQFFALVWLESIQVPRVLEQLGTDGVVRKLTAFVPLFKAPAWFVSFPAGGFYFVLGLYVVGPVGSGVTGAVRYYIDSVFNSTAGQPPAERKEGP